VETRIKSSSESSRESQTRVQNSLVSNPIVPKSYITVKMQAVVVSRGEMEWNAGMFCGEFHIKYTEIIFHFINFKV